MLTLPLLVANVIMVFDLVNICGIAGPAVIGSVLVCSFSVYVNIVVARDGGVARGSTCY